MSFTLRHRYSDDSEESLDYPNTIKMPSDNMIDENWRLVLFALWCSNNFHITEDLEKNNLED